MYACTPDMHMHDDLCVRTCACMHTRTWQCIQHKPVRTMQAPRRTCTRVTVNARPRPRPCRRLPSWKELRVARGAPGVHPLHPSR